MHFFEVNMRNSGQVKQFSGEREEYREWYRQVKNSLKGSGTFLVATNASSRPTNLVPEFWHHDMNQQSNLKLLQNKIDAAQLKWDVDNGKAYFTIMNSLNPALQKRYDESRDPQSELAHWVISDLNARYGGAYDEQIVATFFEETQLPINPNQRFETWSANWESLQIKMDRSIEFDSVFLLSQLKLVLGKSGIQKGERFHEASSFANQSNFDYVQTRNHLISKDTLIPSTNIFNSSTVSFIENNIKQANVESTNYHSWNKNSPKGRHEQQDRHNRDSSRRRKSDEYDDEYESGGDRNDNRRNDTDRRHRNHRSDSRDRYSRSKDSRKSTKEPDNYRRKDSRNRSRSRSQSSVDSRMSRDSRDNASPYKPNNRNFKSESTDRKSSSNRVCYDFEDGKCDRGDKCRYSHDDKINLASMSSADSFKKEWLDSFSMQVDSGAAKTITGDLNTITDYKPYPEPKFMYTITGSRIPILGIGHIGFVPVFYSPDADSGVLATRDLQKKGLMTVFPPGENSGCWIIDPATGSIIVKGDNRYNINPVDLATLQSSGNNDNGKVPYMDSATVQEVHGYSFTGVEADINNTDCTIHTTKSKLTIFDKTIGYRVADIQRTYGYCSKQQLLGYERSIENFPVTEKDINKHFVNFPHYTKGRITRKSFTSEPTLHTEELKIGDVVSTDCIKFADHGGGAGGVQLFLDKKSQYAIGILTKGEGNAQQLSECFTNVKKNYTSYNIIYK